MGEFEVPQALRGMGCGEGDTPSPLGKGSGEGLCRLRRKFSYFFVENTIF